MKKKIFGVIVAATLIMAMNLNVFALGSIVGSMDRPNTSATDKNGNAVTVTVTDAKTNYGGTIQQAVNTMNAAKIDTTVGAALGSVSGIVLGTIDRYDNSAMVEESVNLNAYKFLSPVFDISFGTAPSASNPIKVIFTVHMTDNITVDVLHYCNEHGWEVLTGKKLDNERLEVEFHSASPIALIYKQKGALGTDATSPKTGDVSVMPMMVLSVSLAAAGVYAMKKSRKNEYV